MEEIISQELKRKSYSSQTHASVRALEMQARML